MCAGERLCPSDLVLSRQRPATGGCQSGPVGSAMMIYCAGLGEVTPSVAAGAVAPTAELSRTVARVSVTVGGRPAEVLLSGLAPGFVGLYQITAIIPDGFAPGDAVPVVVSAAGQSSNSVTTGVR